MKYCADMNEPNDRAVAASIPRVDLRREEDADSADPAPRVDVLRPTSEVPPPVARPAVAASAPDPRLSEVEPLLRGGNWEQVLQVLGPAEAAASLPPSLALLYSVARKEREAIGDVAGDVDATALAIRSAATLLGVAEGSALALVVAKRVVRQNPVAWQKRRAPPAKVSALIMIAALVISSLVAWLVFSGHISVRL
jgi:hypothetical protein